MLEKALPLRGAWWEPEPEVSWKWSAAAGPPPPSAVSVPRRAAAGNPGRPLRACCSLPPPRPVLVARGGELLPANASGPVFPGCANAVRGAHLELVGVHGTAHWKTPVAATWLWTSPCSRLAPNRNGSGLLSDAGWGDWRRQAGGLGCLPYFLAPARHPHPSKSLVKSNRAWRLWACPSVQTIWLHVSAQPDMLDANAAPCMFSHTGTCFLPLLGPVQPRQQGRSQAACGLYGLGGLP